MPGIKVNSGNTIKSFIVGKGSFLLHFLQENGFEIYSPCGGNGTCGKCKVYVKGIGDVSSCLYKLEDDIEIVLPGKREVNILTSQYEYSLKLPFYPGKEIDKFPYPLGVAIDLGTTTMVFYFINLLTGGIIRIHSIINPQSKYGGDVISRINYSIQNKNGLRILQSEVIDAINLMISEFIHFESVTSEEIVKITVSGNTTMLHLLLGTDPSSIAFAPFTPVFTDAKKLNASELGIACHVQAVLHILPSLTAYIGADIIAGLASLKTSGEIRNYLFMDIGTNGEMALITNEKIYFCATAAGPAFEGANITCGMGGVEGAISEYSEKGYTTIGNAIPAGICGSGLLDIIAFLLDKALISPDGYMEKEYAVVTANRTSTGRPIIIKPSDVREMQLAKAAISAGINILLDRASLSFGKVDALFLAGGFGNYLRTESALRTGLIPYELRNKIIHVGNTSGTGAVIALRSVFFEDVIKKVLQNTEYIELSGIESFAEEFAMNMIFPDREEIKMKD